MNWSPAVAESMCSRTTYRLRAAHPLILVCALLSSCESAPHRSCPGSTFAPDVKPPLESIAAASADELRGFVGVIVGGEAVDVSAAAEGHIKTIYADVGDIVTRGTVIAALRAKQVELDLELGVAMLTSADAEVQRAVLDLLANEQRLERRQAEPDLFPRELLDELEFQTERARMSLQIARSNLTQHKVRVKQLRDRLRETSVRAPFDGIVAVRYAGPGELVRSGSPILRLVAVACPRVRFAVAPELVSRFAVGTRVRATGVADRMSFHGRVTHIAPEIDSGAQMSFLEAQLDPDQARF